MITERPKLIRIIAWRTYPGDPGPSILNICEITYGMTKQEYIHKEVCQCLDIAIYEGDYVTIEKNMTGNPDDWRTKI